VPDAVSAEAKPGRRNLQILSWVSFVQDVGSEMLYPILPLYLTGVLGAPAVAVGAMEGVAEAVAALLKIASGRFSDGRRRRPFISGGYAISAAGKLLIAVAFSWPLAVAGRVLDRVGKGIRTSPRDALIAGESARSGRGRAFGMQRAANSAGAFLGPLIGLGLYEMLDHQIRWVLLVSVVPAVAAVMLTGLIREQTALPKRSRDPKYGPLPTAYWRTVAFVTIFSLVSFSDALVILRAKALGLSFEAIIGAYVLFNFTYSVLSYPAGYIADRLPRYLVYATGMALFGVAFLGLGMASSGIWVWFLFPVYGAFMALTEGVGRAWVSDHLQDSRTGFGLGVFNGLTGVAALVAGLWAGFAWGVDGRLPLVISGTIGLLLAGLLAAIGHRAFSNRAPTPTP
jgi:MFS family permease